MIILKLAITFKSNIIESFVVVFLIFSKLPFQSMCTCQVLVIMELVIFFADACGIFWKIYYDHFFQKISPCWMLDKLNEHICIRAANSIDFYLSLDCFSNSEFKFGKNITFFEFRQTKILSLFFNLIAFFLYAC